MYKRQVCNFSDVEYDGYQVGVPYAGKYKEVFNSDRKEFGGSGVVNPRVKMSKKAECDERKNSIVIKVPPLSFQIFAYRKEVDKVVDNKTARKKRKTAAGRNLKKELADKML